MVQLRARNMAMHEDYIAVLRVVSLICEKRKQVTSMHMQYVI